jgi:hypothetical protein
VRLGTFNVGGHLPSQDLSVWVRNREEENLWIPPLKKLSPLKVEVEEIKDPDKVSDDGNLRPYSFQPLV